MALCSPPLPCSDTVPPNAGGDICYSIGVSDSSVYLQLLSPSTYTWVAIGTGSEMAGSDMLVVYQDGHGNVTLSPRKGTGHDQPRQDSDSATAKLSLQAGSGVSGNTMRVNLMCTNCSNDLLGTDGGLSPWIAAWKGGDPLNTADQNAGISQHDGWVDWQFNIDDKDPFASLERSPSRSSTTGVVPGDSGTTAEERLRKGHGIILAGSFLVLYPLGSILMPLVGNWIVHASFQIFTFVLMWIGFGLGYVLSQRNSEGFTVSHTVLGTVVVCMMILQPVLGWLHHQHFVKHRARGAVSHAHIWFGRALMLLGIVNGGLGIQLSGEGAGVVAAYAVAAVLVCLVYSGAKWFLSRRKNGHEKKKKRHGNPGESQSHALEGWNVPK
ncbi:hypothetical protein PG996_002571 [Apiospora saccharicola]|uniref:DOMON domain-containing protein n=1 Tax=Apiospora saccharicola TaxID=335842 RepID=A0ABR1WJV9_9PEZI